MPDSLYIHIPFCIKKCIYCDFFSVPYDESTAYAYTDAVCRELSIRKKSARALKTIYIGGGTPSLLPHKCFEELFKCLKTNFCLSPSCEITVEANPGTIDKSKIDLLLSLGVSRLSIGVQSLNNRELRSLGRIHNAEESLHSIELIRIAGVKNFSLDLMYAIPGQTLSSWGKTLSALANCAPQHISAYELTPEEKTPLHDLLSLKNTSVRMPHEDLILVMYDTASDYLKNMGYEHYEISNFALPGFRCVHNLNYWQRGEYLAVGAGAHSFVDGVRSKNISDVRRYIENLKEGIIPESEAKRLSPGEAAREFIFLGLRKTEGINIYELPLSVSDSMRGGDNFMDASGELIDQGYLEITNGYLRLTRKGVVLSNRIIVTLFDKLGL